MIRLKIFEWWFQLFVKYKSEEANKRWDTAVKFYKDGGLKPIVMSYQL